MSKYFKDVKKAKEYLKSIKVDAFRSLDIMDDETILILADANKRMGIEPEDIKEVEFPDA